MAWSSARLEINIMGRNSQPLGPKRRAIGLRVSRMVDVDQRRLGSRQHTVVPQMFGGLNDDQRRQIADRRRRYRTPSNENINIRVNVGERLPPRVRPRPLPSDIVRIVPQYRDYEYTVINDDIAIVDPRTREVVEIIDESGSAGGSRVTSRSNRVTITREQRDLLKQVA